MKPKPRVLVAGTAHAVKTVERVFGDSIDLVAAQSMHEAVRNLASHPDLIICSVRFDDSRMFDFLQTLTLRPEVKSVPVVCCRTEPHPLPRTASHAVELALEALGVQDFADLASLRERYGPEVADETLRQMVRSRLL